MIPADPTADAPQYRTRILHRRPLSERAFELTLARPKDLRFRPGQYIRFHSGEMDRDYSLISGPEADTLTLCVARHTDGDFSRFLADAGPDDLPEFTGPHGYFTYHPSPDQAVFIATGTGIAPFVSYVRSGVTDYVLLHGVNSVSHLYYRTELTEAAREYIPCLSGENGESIPDAVIGRVSEGLSSRVPEGPYTFYLCGRREMIRDITHMIDEHFPGSLVYSESFT